MFRGIFSGVLSGTILSVGCLFGPGIGTAVGQGFDTIYGRGVHQLFDRQCQEAIQSFDLAIGVNDQDPRAWYFRGLAHEFSGNSWAAQSDYQQGAMLEARGNRRSHAVGQALERIQGPTRICIEKIRLEAFYTSPAATAVYPTSEYDSSVMAQPGDMAPGGISAPRPTQEQAPPLIKSDASFSSETQAPEPESASAADDAPALTDTTPFEDQPAVETQQEAPASGDPPGDQDSGDPVEDDPFNF